MNNRCFTLVRRPRGLPRPEDFALVEAPLARPAEGEVLLANRYASIDPAMRGWLDDRPSYLPPVALGEAVRATTLGQVVESRAAGVEPGDWMVGLHALESHSIARPGGFTQKVDIGLVDRPTRYLSALGAVGLTAWFGLHEIGRPRPGETLLVSAAAGAVGSLVGQLGRAAGCRTIGLAGGPGKVRRLIERYGYDVGIDYRGKNAVELAAEIAAHAPGGLDIVFENVGGPGLDAALKNIAEGGRVVLCGLISEYNAEKPRGTPELWQLIARRARIEGFLVSQFLPRFAEGAEAMAGLLAEGRLVVDEHVEGGGLEAAYRALLRLFEGTNEGKMILAIADPSIPTGS